MYHLKKLKKVEKKRIKNILELIKIKFYMNILILYILNGNKSCIFI